MKMLILEYLLNFCFQIFFSFHFYLWRQFSFLFLSLSAPGSGSWRPPLFGIHADPSTVFLGLENSGFTRKHGFSLDIPCLFVKVSPQCEPSRSRFSRNLRVFWQSFRISPLISISYSRTNYFTYCRFGTLYKFSFTGVHDKVQYVYRTYNTY